MERERAGGLLLRCLLVIQLIENKIVFCSVKAVWSVRLEKELLSFIAKIDSFVHT